jgi:hypothetical protein
MVRQPTEYSKRKGAIQEAYRARTHLRKSRGMLIPKDANDISVKQMEQSKKSNEESRTASRIFWGRRRICSCET